jgi:hypothetical protein
LKPACLSTSFSKALSLFFMNLRAATCSLSTVLYASSISLRVTRKSLAAKRASSNCSVNAISAASPLFTTVLTIALTLLSTCSLVFSSGACLLNQSGGSAEDFHTLTWAWLRICFFLSGLSRLKPAPAEVRRPRCPEQACGFWARGL